MTVDMDNDLKIEAAEQGTRPQDAAAKHAEASQIFFYSAYVHVGPGAGDCDDRETGTCSDPRHFHAWCRLPNKLQHRDITEKALGAKARRVRALRDSESDAYAVFDAELSNITPDHLETMIDELVMVDFDTEYIEATKDADEEERFEHIAADRERYEELYREGEADKPDEEQTDEFRELHRHIGAYVNWLQERARERLEPRRAHMREQGFDAVMNQLRDRRIDRSGNAEFSRVLKEWVMFIGTYKVNKHDTTGQPFERMWSSIGSIENAVPGTMWGAAPEVIEAVEAMFESFNRSLVLASVGNS